MEFILLGIGIIVFALFVGAMTEESKEELELIRRTPIITCLHHSWSVNPVSNKLTCTRCNFEAGIPEHKDSD